MKLVNRLNCNLKLGDYTIEAGSEIDLAKDKAEALLAKYPNLLIKKNKKCQK